ncbi:MAG: hypothetical protein RJA44_400 [Pseudomonadota bacterium]
MSLEKHQFASTRDVSSLDPQRRRSLQLLAALALPAGVAPSLQAAPGVRYADVGAADLGHNASLNGGVPFPADNAWNRDVSTLPVDPASDAIIAAIGAEGRLRPDFGSGSWKGGPIGIPYVVVSGRQEPVQVRWMAYGGQSDPGPYPVPRDAVVEGGLGSDGDRHVLVIDRDRQRLYELYRAFPQTDGSWYADSGAVFDLRSNNVRPGGQPGWTSADAAGLPIFPGLVRFDEAMLGPGGIRHALRFTVKRSRRAYVPPATHYASRSTDPWLPPMGARLRLRASFNVPADFSVEARAIIAALKRHGMILADNGSNWYLSGAPDPRWQNKRLIDELGSLRGGDFEVLRMDGLVSG